MTSDETPRPSNETIAPPCLHCARPVQAGALFCLHCGTQQPRVEGPATPRAASGSERGVAFRPLMVRRASVLVLVLMVAAAALFLITRGGRSATPAPSPTTASASQVQNYLSRIHQDVLGSTHRADDAMSQGIQLMRQGDEAAATAHFVAAVQGYSGAVTALGSMNPPDSYLLYHDDLLQALNFDVQAASAYSEWSAGRSHSHEVAGARWAHSAQDYLTRASGDAPPG